MIQHTLYVVWYNLSFVCDGKLNVQLKDKSLWLDYYLKKPCLLHLYLSESSTKHLVEYLFSLLKMWNKCCVMHALIIINHTWFEIQHKEEYFLSSTNATYICSFSIIRSLVKMFQVKWSSMILGKPLINKNMFYTRGSIGKGFGAKQTGRVILSWCLALSHCARPLDSSTVYLNSVCCKNFHDQKISICVHDEWRAENCQFQHNRASIDITGNENFTKWNNWDPN
jgi:hypothetical protein